MLAKSGREKRIIEMHCLITIIPLCSYHVAVLRPDPAVVLVAPDDQVEEGGQEALWDVTGGAALGAILVKNQQVEPAVSILLRPLELNLQNTP